MVQGKFILLGFFLLAIQISCGGRKQGVFDPLKDQRDTNYQVTSRPNHSLQPSFQLNQTLSGREIDGEGSTYEECSRLCLGARSASTCPVHCIDPILGTHRGIEFDRLKQLYGESGFSTAFARPEVNHRFVQIYGNQRPYKSQMLRGLAFQYQQDCRNLYNCSMNRENLGIYGQRLGQLDDLAYDLEQNRVGPTLSYQLAKNYSTPRAFQSPGIGYGFRDRFRYILNFYRNDFKRKVNAYKEAYTCSYFSTGEVESLASADLYMQNMGGRCDPTFSHLQGYRTACTRDYRYRC